MEPLYRRQFLGVGAAAGGAVLAGCAGDGESTPTTTDRPDDDAGETTAGPPSAAGEFGVSGLDFATREPTGYAEYDREPGATFLPGEPAWLYAGLDGVAGEPGDGELAVSVAVDVAVTGPDGEVVAEESPALERTVAGEDALAELYVATELGLPEPPPAGDYEVTLSATDGVAGASATGTGTFAVEPLPTAGEESALGISRLAACRTEPSGFGEFEPQPDATYPRGSAVWLYYEVDGADFDERDDGFYVRAGHGMRVFDTEGHRVQQTTDRLARTFDSEAGVSRVFVVERVDTASDELPAGTYEAEVLIQDGLSGDRASAEIEFWLTE